MLDAAVLHTLQISKGAAVKAVKFTEDFPWYYSRVFGTRNEIWGYRNTVEATKLTPGGKTQPTNPSLPSWGNACFWGWGMSNWCIYTLQWSWSPSYPNGTLGFPHYLRKKKDGVPGEAFSAAVNRYLGWNEDEFIQYRLTPRGQVSWAEVKYCCNRQTTAWGKWLKQSKVIRAGDKCMAWHYVHD